MHYIDNAGYSAQPVRSLSTTKAIVTRYSDDTFSHQLRGYQMEIKLMRLGLNTHSITNKVLEDYKHLFNKIGLITRASCLERKQSA